MPGLPRRPIRSVSSRATRLSETQVSAGPGVPRHVNDDVQNPECGPLEILLLMGLTIISVLHWDQFLALFGFGSEPARFTIALKPEPLPWPYVTVILAAVLLFEVIPYIAEFIRGLRANRGRLVPQK